jgi:hypothetical protein
MLVAKCASCKNKRELQACKVCDEAKCSVCAQEHQTVFEEKSKKIQTRLIEIRRQTGSNRTFSSKPTHNEDRVFCFS